MAHLKVFVHLLKALILSYHYTYSRPDVHYKIWRQSPPCSCLKALVQKNKQNNRKKTALNFYYAFIVKSFAGYGTQPPGYKGPGPYPQAPPAPQGGYQQGYGYQQIPSYQQQSAVVVQQQPQILVVGGCPACRVGII